MKRTMILLALVAVVAFGAFAQTANQTVTLTVGSIYKIAVTGSPSLSIASTDFTAGGLSATKSDAATAKYSYTTNTTTNKVTAILDVALPTGLTLTCDMGDGAISLSDAAAATVKSNLARGAGNNVAITYALTATTDADAYSGNHVVTFTFSN